MSAPARLVPLGLVANAAALVLFAIIGTLAASDRLFLVLQAVAVVIAAWGLREWTTFPSEGVTAFGLVAFAVLQVLHFGLSVSDGMPIVPLVAFLLFVVGAIVAAIGAVQWNRAANGGGEGFIWIRAGWGLVGLTYLYYVVVSVSAPLVAIGSLLGLIGSALVALLLTPDGADATADAAGPAQPS